jgi:SPP1 gp7 family putative phage head morphogenesis protein
MREVLRRDSQRQVREFQDALDAGAQSIAPDVSGLSERILPIFEQHRDRVIHVAVSDGIQEVSPENELGLWLRFPDTYPVEETLSVSLAKKRDEIVEKAKRAAAKANAGKPQDLAGGLVDAYLKNLKEAYRRIAADWLEGESTIQEVIRGIQIGLKKSDSESQGIFRTQTTNYFNESRHEYFTDNTSVDYMQFYAVTDGRVSNICEARHEIVFPIAQARDPDFMPALHPWCRSIQRPLISALTTHKRIIDEHLITDAEKQALPPTAWEHAHAA